MSWKVPRTDRLGQKSETVVAQMDIPLNPNKSKNDWNKVDQKPELHSCSCQDLFRIQTGCLSRDFMSKFFSKKLRPLPVRQLQFNRFIPNFFRNKLTLSLKQSGYSLKGGRAGSLEIEVVGSIPTSA